LSRVRDSMAPVNKYNVPKIAFVNKMDRPGADFFAVLKGH